MGVLKSPAHLDAEIANALERFLRAAFVQAAVLNPFPQGAVIHVLREYARHAAEAADIVATDDVRVKSEIDPGLALLLEIGGAVGAEHDAGLRAFHGKRHVPAAVDDFVDFAHPAFAQQAGNLVEAED